MPIHGRDENSKKNSLITTYYTPRTYKNNYTIHGGNSLITTRRVNITNERQTMFIQR